LALPEARDRLTGAPIVTSAVTGAGVDALRSAIARSIERSRNEDNLSAGVGARCRESLSRAGSAVRSGAATLARAGGDELMALDLRLAVDDLGKGVGAVVTDDVLDRIFRRFCIGK